LGKTSGCPEILVAMTEFLCASISETARRLNYWKSEKPPRKPVCVVYFRNATTTRIHEKNREKRSKM